MVVINRVKKLIQIELKWEAFGKGSGNVRVDTADLEHLVALAEKYHEVAAEVAELRSYLNPLASESSGVAGYHLNGDIAGWDEFPELFYSHSKTGSEDSSQ